jgi:hypothetical protein
VSINALEAWHNCFFAYFLGNVPLFSELGKQDQRKQLELSFVEAGQKWQALGSTQKNILKNEQTNISFRKPMIALSGEKIFRVILPVVSRLLSCIFVRYRCDNVLRLQIRLG